MTPEEIKVLNQWTERYKAGTWGIYINGVRVRAKSGKSAFLSLNRAKAALTNLVKYGHLAYRFGQLRRGATHTNKEDIKMLITELAESGRLHFLEDRDPFAP